MNELDSKITNLDALQSEIPFNELKNICIYIEKHRETFPTDPLFVHLPKDKIGTQFPVRFNTLSNEIDIFLDCEKPFGQGETRITIRSLQYNREEVVAIKILQTKQFSSVERFIQDIHNLQTLQGEPGIAPVYEFYQTKINNHEHLELIQKFYNQGNLNQFLETNTPSGQQIISILDQLLTTVANIHQKRFLFQDLSPQNCLINLSGNIVKLGIGDLERLLPIDSIIPTTFEWYANRTYASPEFWKCAFDLISFADIPKEHWQKIDMWGVGCCLWELLSDSPLPWINAPHHNPEALLKLTSIEIIEPKDSNSLEHLLWEMMRENPNQRIDAQQALKKLHLKN